MDEDFAIRRGATIDLRKIDELPGVYVAIPVEERMVLDESGKELRVQTMVIEAEGQKLYVILRTEPHDHQKRHVVHSSNRPIQGRAGDHAYFRDKIIEPHILNTDDGPRKGYMVEVHGAHGPQRIWRSEETMMFLEEQPDHADTADTSWHGAKARGVARAIDELWPNGPPPTGLAGAVRDNMVREKMIANGDTPPVNIARAVQRALAAREEAHGGGPKR